MSYYFSKTIVAGNFSEAVAKAKEAAQQAGFGIVSEMNMQNTFKEKLNIAFRNYTILGVCNPKYAHKAIGLEAKIGLFLPCNMLIEEESAGQYTISAVDPVEMMLAIENDQLIIAAYEIREMLKKMIDSL